jgi:chromosome segregation ATPase
MMHCALLAVLLVPASSTAITAEQNAELKQNANPVRKVVTMLQMMMKKIEEEGVKEKELYDKFMCYCATADTTLGKSISDANTKIPQLESDIKQAVEEKTQLEEDIAAHQADRTAAEEAMAKATEMREKEAAAFAKEMGEDKANLDSLAKALAAIEKGMAGGFLQTNAANVLRKLVVTKMDMVELDRKELVAFLQGSQSDEYAPASGEIVGILKQLQDEMQGDLKELIAQEDAAIKAYDELMAAKKTEVETLTKAIEEKLVRVGELGVKIAEMKNDLEDTVETLGEDTKYLADLGTTCAAKTKEWDARCKSRSEELLALSDTIKILNDDDALELFKKTLPSASFLQVQVSQSQLRAKALQLVKASQNTAHHKKSLSLDFILLALRGKKVGFEKVIKLMDEMVVLLKKEQVDDDNKKEYCTIELDLADDKKKEVERAISDSEKAIAEVEEGVMAVTEEIEALEAGIVALDKSVAEATQQRKEENEDYTALMAGNTAAKELILFAKNRMQKFYNPKLYKPPPKRELTEEERITLNMGGTLAPTNPPGGIAGTGVSLVQVRDVTTQTSKAAPPPPPEASFGGKKSEESGGVLAMMDMLVSDLDKEMTAADLEEKDAQGDYEKTMSDAADKRAGDTKDLTDKKAAKATLDTEMQAHTDAKKASETELKATKDYIETLHNDCDFLLEYYAERKDARASEIDAIGKAKAVLSGADFSLVQTGTQRFLEVKSH